MKTFKEYAENRDRELAETDGGDDPLITQAITQLGLKNPKIIAGATDQKTAARAMTTPQVRGVMKKEGPASAGKVSAALTGDQKSTPTIGGI